MKLSFLKSVVFLSMLSFVVFSCSKDDDNNSGKSRTELLAMGTWKFDNAALDVDKDGTAETPMPAGVIDDCEKDNTITFNTNGTGTVDEGPTKCDPADPQTASFGWTFQSNETVLNFQNQIFPGFDGDVNVKSISETKLVLTKDADLGLPQSVRVVVELKH